jgi:hypothetical protein
MYPGSYIALVEDLYDPKPAFRETLARDTEEMREAFGGVERVSINNTIKSLTELTSKKKIAMPALVEEQKPEFGLEPTKLVETTLTPIVCKIPIQYLGTITKYDEKYAIGV